MNTTAPFLMFPRFATKTARNHSLASPHTSRLFILLRTMSWSIRNGHYSSTMLLVFGVFAAIIASNGPVALNHYKKLKKRLQNIKPRPSLFATICNFSLPTLVAKNWHAVDFTELWKEHLKGEEGDNLLKDESRSVEGRCVMVRTYPPQVACPSHLGPSPSEVYVKPPIPTPALEGLLSTSRFRSHSGMLEPADSAVTSQGASSLLVAEPAAFVVTSISTLLEGVDVCIDHEAAISSFIPRKQPVIASGSQERIRHPQNVFKLPSIASSPLRDRRHLPKHVLSVSLVTAGEVEPSRSTIKKTLPPILEEGDGYSLTPGRLRALREGVAASPFIGQPWPAIDDPPRHSPREIRSLARLYFDRQYPPAFKDNATLRRITHNAIERSRQTLGAQLLTGSLGSWDPLDMAGWESLGIEGRRTAYSSVGSGRRSLKISGADRQMYDEPEEMVY